MFSGSELELYLTLPKGNKIDCLYEGCLSKLAEYDEKDIAPAPEVFKEMRKELQESLIGTLYQSRLRPVMPLNGMFNGWMKIREMIPELYLGAGALRKRVKEISEYLLEEYKQNKKESKCGDDYDKCYGNFNQPIKIDVFQILKLFGCSDINDLRK